MCTPAIALGTIAAGAATKNILTPKLPSLPEEPGDAPKAIDQNVLDARQRERDKARAAQGRQSTILTGSGGLTTTPVTSGKTLLGQ